MKNVLFFMHVPWGWIRQRPHFIAEGLSRRNNVYVVYEKPFKTGSLVNNKSDLNISELFRLPIKRYSFLYFINVYLVSRNLVKMCRDHDIDIIWVTDVRLYSYINNIEFGGVRIIYDCMDETLKFPYIAQSARLSRIISNDEIGLANMSEHIFCSSKTIMNGVIERTCVKKENVSVVNNALDSSAGQYRSLSNSDAIDASVADAGRDNKVIVTYVGTISEWFDLDCIMQSLDSNPEISYLLVGPVEIALPRHDRIIITGPVEHQYVNYILYKSDILVMPFKRNALIESVDPVKLYEYVTCEKPVVALEYEETRKFSSYVYLYTTCNDYVKIINDLVTGRRLNREYSISEFIEKNTWDNRVDQICEYLDKNIDI